MNFCVSFVREHWKPNEEGALLSELVRQIKYIIHVGGEECLGLGSDFDGIEEVPPEMKNAEGLPFLAEAMEKEGIPYSQIEKVFFKNVKRVFKRKSIGKKGDLHKHFPIFSAAKTNFVVLAFKIK